MKLKAPEGCTGCSFGGQEYKVKKGIVDVPDEALFALREHGFYPVAPTDEEIKAAQIADAQQAVVAAQGALDAETDDAKKADLAQALEAAKAELAALEA